MESRAENLPVSRASVAQFLRYGLVGAAATVAHYLLVILGVEYVGWPAWIASGIGAVLGAQVAYAGNRHFTFHSDAAVTVSWLRFQAVAMAGALLGMAVVAVGVAAGVHYLLAQCVATGLSLLLTFVFNRTWTFR